MLWLPRLKVLVVDDEEEVLRSVTEGLILRGFQVDAYPDPDEALRRFKKGVYGIALLDIRMPRMNGFQLYRELLLRDPELRVRFFTAFEEYRDEFKKAFPDLDEGRFIRKPTPIARLAGILVGELNDTQADRA